MSKKRKIIAARRGKSGAKTQTSQKTQSHSQKSRASDKQQHDQPQIPFSPEDAILLVGEGNLSFARSLLEHHVCENVTATVLEANLEELRSKHPDIQENIDAIQNEGGKLMYGVDVTSMKPFTRGKGKDAVGVMDRIIFNFPHTGGKSTDINRQVRYNQQLLVSFFTRAQLSLSPRPGSSIIVTLFEGEPYTLWNIRDLARHAGGLVLEKSFRFQAAAYPGYSHARTFGTVRAKEGRKSMEAEAKNKGKSEEGVDCESNELRKDGKREEKRGWKGEERAARSYVFVRKPEEKREEQLEDRLPGESVTAARKRKRRKAEEDSDDSD